MTSPTDTSPMLGDRAPDAVAAYYRSLDDSRFADAAATFTDDVLYAVPAADAIETAPRVETVGRAALLERFEARGPRPFVHDILLCAVDGAACLVEGVSRPVSTEGRASSFVASLQLDASGVISRYLAYAAAPAVVPAPAQAAAGPASPGDARAVLDRYFHALDDGAFEEAAACFSEDVLYSHPPYMHTGIEGNQRVEFHGRTELLAKFRERGAQSFDHRLLACIQRGPHCLVEGLVEGLPEGRSGSFISSFTLDGDGLIRRYLSFYCEPSVRMA